MEEEEQREKQSKEELVESILQLQKTIEEQTQKVDFLQKQNQDIRDENSMLKEYLENLMQKVTHET